VLIIRDIHQQKVLEMQKARFIANAAHELRTPILHLSTNLYLLRQKPQQLDEYLHRLELIVGRMNRLANDLLDVTSFEHGRIQLNLEPIILQDLVWEIVALYQSECQKKQQRLLYDAPMEPLSLIGDGYRLKQVVVNLLQNATTYTAEGGVIAVRLRAGGQQQVILQVHDNGKGIPSALLEHIFEPFYRIEETGMGTGLGLSIAREIVHMHQGSISVGSTADLGTLFTVRLPGA
jgi:two-component system phosphate regulon sensor histidine kinase PhoR